MEIFGSVVRGLGEALHLHEARHRVIVENLANVETPGYRARDLEFDDALHMAFERDGERADRAPEPSVDRSAQVKIDGNSVDAELEMARLSDNSFRIASLSRILARRYAGMKELITEMR
jgi:flagellar basal-body rod protein FlgB